MKWRQPAFGSAGFRRQSVNPGAAPDRAIRAHIQDDLLVTEDHPRIAFRDGAELRIAVANGGTPIPETAREHLFQPFYRGEVSPGPKGLGLGLFIASEIAKAHGGRIDVTSDASETRFTFVAPIA